MISHHFPRADGAGLAEGLEVLFAAYVLQVRVCDDEVGCKHGCCQLSAVGAVAKKRINEAGSVCGLRGRSVLRIIGLVVGRHSLLRLQDRRGLTNASCTAPQKHVDDALSSVDQPSFAEPARGIYGFDLSADAAIAEGTSVISDQWWTVGNGGLRTANCSATNVPTACSALLCLGYLDEPKKSLT